MDWQKQWLPNTVHSRTHAVVAVVVAAPDGADGEGTWSTVLPLVAVAVVVDRQSNAC